MQAPHSSLQAYSVSTYKSTNNRFVMISGLGLALVYKSEFDVKEELHSWDVEPGVAIMLNDEVVLCASIKKGLVIYSMQGSFINKMELKIPPRALMRVDEHRFLVVNEGNKFIMYHHDAGLNIKIARMNIGHTKIVTSMNRHGSTLVTGSVDCLCVVWNIDTLQYIQSIKFPEPLSSVAVSNSLIVAGTACGKVWISKKSEGYGGIKKLEDIHDIDAVMSVYVVEDELVVSVGMDGKVVYYLLKDDKVIEQPKVYLHTICDSVVSDGMIVVCGGGTKDERNIMYQTIRPPDEIRHLLQRIS